MGQKVLLSFEKSKLRDHVNGDAHTNAHTFT